MNLDTLTRIVSIMATCGQVLTLVFTGLQLRQNALLTRMAGGVNIVTAPARKSRAHRRYGLFEEKSWESAQAMAALGQD